MPFRPEELARLHALATTYPRRSPSDYLALPDHTPAERYWRWAVDDACRTCAAVLAERHRRAAADRADGITTFRVVKRSPR